MKSVFLIVSSCGLFLGLLSVNNRYTGLDLINTYSARIKNGKMQVMHQGKPILNQVILANGTQVKPDGTVLTVEGLRKRLKEGECIDMAGKFVDCEQADLKLYTE